MKKRTEARLKRDAVIALLDRENPTNRMYRDEIVIADAKRKFGKLGYDNLDHVRNRSDLVDQLEQMYRDYRCSAGAADQAIARELQEFISKYGLRS